MIPDKPPLDEVLEHHGIKGMHWGVRKAHDVGGGRSSGGGKSTHSFSARDKAVLKAGGVSEKDSEALKAKYGPESMKPVKEPRLSPGQKEMIKNLVIAGGIAAGMYYLHGQGVKQLADLDPSLGKGKYKGLPEFTKEWKLYQKTASDRQMGYSADMIAKLGKEPHEFPAGAIFKRISTEKETHIKPEGFFASPHEADVERYKAILPVFWPQWGLKAEAGYVVHLRAKTPIKAPSERETYDMFHAMLGEKVKIQEFSGVREATVRDLFHSQRMEQLDDKALAARYFPAFAANWNNPNHPATKHFMEQLKSKGYNALIDMNDAGSLSKKPMKLLDGKLFEVAKHEELSKDAIRIAQQNIMALAHAMLTWLGENFLVHLGIGGGEDMLGMEKPPLDDDTLEHFGVKGMHWGSRKGDHPGVDHKTNHAARKDAVEFARAKMFYGDGAGTRRKLIKAKVESQSKINPNYKKAFDHHLAQQDMGEHAGKAQTERKIKNTKASVGKTARGINRAIQGPFGSTIAVSALVGGAGYMKAHGLDKKVMAKGRQFANQYKHGTKVDLSFLNR